MALFLNLARERLPAMIVTEYEGLWHGRLLTESTNVGQNEDAVVSGIGETAAHCRGGHVLYSYLLIVHAIVILFSVCIIKGGE